MAINRTNLEIEMKCFVGEEQYNSLLQEFNLLDDVHAQTNYYFDTDNLDLQNNKIVLRIRQKGEQYKLTSKSKGVDGNIENHVYITKEEALAMLKNGFDAKIINLPYHVKNLCRLTTYRASCQYKCGKLFLDKSTYGNKTDFEIEFEVTDKSEGEKVFDEFLSSHNITKTIPISKCKRAFNEINQLKRKEC